MCFAGVALCGGEGTLKLDCETLKSCAMQDFLRKVREVNILGDTVSESDANDGSFRIDCVRHRIAGDVLNVRNLGGFGSNLGGFGFRSLRHCSPPVRAARGLPGG